MPDVEIEAFEPVTVTKSPSVVQYQNQQYWSDRNYLDTHGSLWTYYGLHNGSSMWVRPGDSAAWNITALVDSVGPLVEQDGAA